MKSKIITIAALLFLFASQANAQTFWDGTATTDWTGSGTEASPYLITTPQQLAGIAAEVNAGTNLTGKFIKLANDIYLSNPADADINKPLWTPIGKLGNEFNGVFDGDGYQVSGVYINNATGNFQGLFGYITFSAEIKNLGVTDSYINGNNYVGGVVGDNCGKITNCYSSANVNGAEYVGGLAGRNYGSAAEIIGSYATGNVSGTDYVGGLTGDSTSADITNCYATGNVSGTSYIGGLAGKDGIVTNCYATGKVTGSTYVGGLLGNNDYVIYNVIKNSFYNSETTGQSDTGKGAAKTTAEMKLMKTFTGWDFTNIWGRNNTINNGYPYLRWSFDGFIENDLDPVAVTGVTLNKTTVSLLVGATEQLEKTVQPSGATNKNVTWSSNNTTVAEVSQTGLVTAKAAGSATIIATTEDGNFTAQCVVTVSAPTYTISASTLTSFGSLQAPYAQPAAKTVTITSTGTGAVTLTQPTAENYDIGALSTTTLASGATATFTVCPKAGLVAGTYNENITINGSNGASATVSASFSVIAPTYIIIASTLTSFGSLQTPYEQPAAKTVTITNNGTGAVTLSQPTADNYVIGALSTSTLTTNGATATFTIRPKAELAVGTYDETITISGSSGASTTVNVNFSVTAALTYIISASTLTTFGSLQTPYTQPDAKTVTITNNGTGAVTLSQPTADNYVIGALSTSTLTTNGATATFTIRPKAELAVGTYDETITITGTNDANATVDVSFSVTAAPIVDAQTPIIDVQPQNVTVKQNGSATLAINAHVDDGGTLSFQWFSNTEFSATGGTSIFGATGASYSPTTATTGTRYYYAIVTNTNPGVTGVKTAVTTSSVAQVTVQPVTGVEISDVPIARIYPNPTDGVLSLEFETAGAYHITLADMSGKSLLRQTVCDRIARLDLSNYPAGFYLLTIDDGKRQDTVRVVKN